MSLYVLAKLFLSKFNSEVIIRVAFFNKCYLIHKSLFLIVNLNRFMQRNNKALKIFFFHSTSAKSIKTVSIFSIYLLDSRWIQKSIADILKIKREGRKITNSTTVPKE